MPLTTLDPVTALIVVDIQKGIVGLPTIHPIADVIGKINALLDEFHRLHLPVVLVNVAGAAPGRTEQPPRVASFSEGWTDLSPDLHQQPGDLLITKRTWGAFTHTGLDSQLKAKSVTHVVVAGVATGTGVDATARQAYEHGFNVTLALDAMTDMRAVAHDYTLAHVFPRLGETGTTHEIIDLPAKRSA